MPTVLIIDDNAVVTALDVAALAARHRTLRACLAGGRPGGAGANAKVDLVIQDMNFQRRHHLAARRRGAVPAIIRERHPDLPVILLTAWTHLESAVDLVKAGAADYLAKPWDDRKLLATVRNLLELGESNAPCAQGARERRSAALRWRGLRPARHRVRRQPAMRARVRAGLSGGARRRAGAGHRPEWCRQGAHRRDRAGQFRVRDGPFVAVNCGALPAT
jgi:DNA-binding NtrC family response regulator